MIPQQQPQPPPFSIGELGAKFGVPLSQAFGEIITLEKLLGSQNKAIEEMVETEKSLSNRIQELEVKIAEFLEQEAILVEHIQGLEADVSPMSEAAAVVSQAKKIVEDI